MIYFFYGTLTDPDVLRAVLRRPLTPLRRRRAVLPGFRSVYRRGATYPLLIADPASVAPGMLVDPLTRTDAARLAAYEGPDYATVQLRVVAEAGPAVTARVFLPVPGVEATATPWTLAEWQQRHKSAFPLRLRSSRHAPGGGSPGASGGR